MTKTFFKAGSLIIILLSFGLLIKNSQALTDTAKLMPVSVADLTAAGFTKAKALAPAGGRYDLPTYYFSVAEKTSLPSEATNLIMVNIGQSNNANQLVYTYGANSLSFTITGGLGQEGIMPDGRVAISFIKGSNYIVLMGPNKIDMEKLATAVANRLAAQ